MANNYVELRIANACSTLRSRALNESCRPSTLVHRECVRPQMLQVKGGGWTFAANEEGTRTISWPTEECTEDGGRFKIDVMVKRGIPSIGDADRESIELLVNCGFFRKR